MTAEKEHLILVFDNLFRIRNECSCGILSECGLSDMTVKQIHYLKTIDENGEVTFSRLAELTKTSKPTITETINKFVRMDCVYRQPCPDDGRIQYIRLTEKGQMIARAEQQALLRVIERMTDSLDENEIDVLIDILRKVG
jgi:DNA-binding MarR family transcriptional regulator